MVTAERTRANRQNALRSTGPRTRAGKIVSSANSLKFGLFTRQFVIPALGESVETWELFRAAVVADLDADGVLEVELAGRVAQLLWRTRRVGVYEAAASAPASLPPHPDEVGPWRGEMFLPVPPTATTAEHLARARTRVLTARTAAAGASDALALAQRIGHAGPDGPLDTGPVLAFLDAAGEVLGWDKYAEPSSWVGVLRDLGAKRTSPDKVAWTVTLLNRVIDRAAVTSGRTPGEVLERVIGALRAESEAAVQNVRHWDAEERLLIGTLITERSAAAARALYADDTVLQRVTRAESHLSRELDRALAAYERVRSMRSERMATLADQVELGSFCRSARRN